MPSELRRAYLLVLGPPALIAPLPLFWTHGASPLGIALYELALVLLFLRARAGRPVRLSDAVPTGMCRWDPQRSRKLRPESVAIANLPSVASVPLLGTRSGGHRFRTSIGESRSMIRVLVCGEPWRTLCVLTL